MKVLAMLLTLLLLPFLSTAQSSKSSPIPKKDECIVSGMVVKLAGSEPLKNARVQLLNQDDRAESHSVVTDAGGRFDLRGLDPGRYRLAVHKDGFVTQAYGQKKPDDPGAILTLRAKQEVKDLLFRLIPSAVIAGRVINDDGDPLPWVQVSALREAYAAGKKTLFSETTVPTNDLGEYRLFGLPPAAISFAQTTSQMNESPVEARWKGAMTLSRADMYRCTTQAAPGQHGPLR